MFHSTERDLCSTDCICASCFWQVSKRWSWNRTIHII